MNRDQIGAVVKEKRMQMNLTQQQLAILSGVGYQRIIEIEKNRRSYSVEVLLLILQALGLSLSIQSGPSIGITNVKFKFTGLKSAKDGDENNKQFNQLKKEQNETETIADTDNHLIIGGIRVIL